MRLSLAAFSTHLGILFLCSLPPTFQAVRIRGRHDTLGAIQRQLHVSNGSSGARVRLGASLSERPKPVDIATVAFTALFVGGVVAGFGFVAFKAVSTIEAYLTYIQSKREPHLRQARTGLDALEEEDERFRTYLQYHVGNWFTYATYPAVKILLFVSAVIALSGIFVYLLVLKEDVMTAAYHIFVWLVAPDGGVNESTKNGSIIGGVISLCGLLIFALLMTTVGIMFDNYISGLAAGSTPAMECGHIVILGFTSDTIPLVQAMCDAHEELGGTTIAILSGRSKPEVEHELDDSGLLVGEQLKGSRVVVRSGLPHRAEDLKLVSADLCRTAIPMPDRTVEKDLRDAYMLQVVAALRSNNWPVGDGRVIAFCSIKRNLETFKAIGGDRTDVVNLDDLLASVCVTGSLEKGTLDVLDQLFKFEGSELHVAGLPAHLDGRSFGELSLWYPQCIPLGVIKKHDKQDVELCPKPDLKVTSMYELILFAEDERAMHPTDKALVFSSLEGHSRLPDADLPDFFRHPLSTRGEDAEEVKSETILVTGWSSLIGPMLLFIDERADPGTKILSFAAESVEARIAFCQRSLKRHQKKGYKNITIEYYTGQPGSIYQMEEAGRDAMSCRAPSGGSQGDRTESPYSRARSWDGLKMFDTSGIEWHEITRAFVLADDKAADPWRSDAICMTAALQVQALVGLDIPVVLESRDPSSREVCRKIGIGDVVCSAQLPSSVMATVSQQPKLKEVLLQLFGQTASFEVNEQQAYEYEIRIRKMSDYWPADQLPMESCFFAVADDIRKTGAILIGWRLSCVESDRSPRSSVTVNSARKQLSRKASEEFLINPLTKFEKVWLSGDSRLAVVSRRTAGSFRRSDSVVSAPSPAGSAVASSTSQQYH